MKHESLQTNRVDNLRKELAQKQDPFPLIIEIHPTDICNQKCDYCFHGGVGYDRTRVDEIISTAQYSSLFAQMSDHKIRILSISGGGEPTIDVRLPQLIADARNQNLQLRMVSNGNFIDRVPNALECDELRFSLDAVSGETYARLRHVSPTLFTKTIANIEQLVASKAQAHAQTSIGVTFLVNEINAHEAVAFCKSMVDRGLDSVVIKFDIYDKITLNSERMQTVASELADLQLRAVDYRGKLDIKPHGKPCFVPYFKVAFNPYGELFSCCLGSQPNEKNGYKLGNIGSSTLKQIWESSADMRKQMTRGVSCVNCNHTDYELNAKVKQ